MAVVAAPYVVAAAGFGAGGVAAGSVAANVMGVAWTTGWGAGTVAVLQSVGAAGLTLAQSIAVGSVAGVATAAASSSMKGVCSVPDLVSQCLLMYM